MTGRLRRASLLIALFLVSSALLSSLWLPSNISESAVLSSNSVSSIGQSNISESARFSDIVSPIKLIKSPAIDSSYNYRWQSEESDSGAYYSMLETELSKYQKSDFQKLGIYKIYLVDKLETKNGTATLGFSDISTGAIYLNVLHKRADTELVKTTLHHEIGHFVSISDRGYSVLSEDSWQGQSNYGLRDELKNHTFKEDGFVTHYAKTSVAEDMSEVYAFMMSDYYSDKLKTESRQSEVLAAKVDDVDSMITRLGLSVDWR